MRLLAAALLAGAIVHAQDAQEFDVVSVRQFAPVRGTPVVPKIGCPNGRFTAAAQAAWQIIDWAYKMDDYRLFGLPQWAGFNGQSFIVEAKAAPSTTEEQCRVMAQKMLADRFKLTFHREMRSLPAYAMTVAKGGIKMKPVMQGDEGLGIHIKINGSEMRGSPGADAKPPVGWSMETLINQVLVLATLPAPGEKRRPVLDRTGLEGLYKFSLEMGMGIMGQPVPEGFPEPFTAFREQLGLEIKPVTEPFEVLVVERLEKPDAN